MLLYLTRFLQEYFSAFNVFSYLTMRAILGALTALLISLIVGPKMIKRLSHYQIGQTVRDDGPETHLEKAGTPTMGGALILVAVIITTLLWANLENRFVWIVIGVTLAFGTIGFVDDYRKLVLRDSAGLRPGRSTCGNRSSASARRSRCTSRRRPPRSRRRCSCRSSRTCPSRWGPCTSC